MAKPNKKAKVTALAMLTTAAWCAVAAAVLYLFPAIFDGLNNRMYDWKLSLETPPDQYRRIVHLDVDDAAIGQFGLWPWDRSISAEMVRRLKAMGAAMVVFDVLYTTPRPGEGDEALFKAVKEAGNVVMPVAMGLSYNEQEKLVVDVDASAKGDLVYDNAWNLDVPKMFALPKAVTLKSSGLPLLPLLQDAKAFGHITGTPDRDGVYRRIPLLVKLEDKYVPHVSLATLAAVLGLSPDTINVSKKGYIELTPVGQPIRIPVDSSGRMLIHWGPIWESFPHYSVTDVMSDKPDASRAARYKDKIVVVGVVATGTTDFGVTPVGVHSPLNRIHSNALSTILMNNFILHWPAWPFIILKSIIVTILFSFIAGRLRLRNAILLAIGLCVFSVGYVIALFNYVSLDVPLAEFLFIFVPGAFAGLIVRTATLELQASRASKAVERYLSPELLESIVEQGMELDLSTKRTELTVMFVDVQGFSTISEVVDVEYINRLLNEFFEAMTKAIFQHKGTVDKFLGDGILAFFGNPVPLENHAQAGLRAALEMQRSMDELNARVSQWGIAELENGIRIRIGMNSGLMIVGNIGSSRRLEYTVLGSTVNIASRLQSLAPSGGIIVTTRTKQLAREDVQYDGPDHVKVKGIDREIEVFRIYPEAIKEYYEAGR
jgi:adenylate cyclase